jgi:hypothetical protein
MISTLDFRCWLEAIVDPQGNRFSAHDVDSVLQRSHPELNQDGIFCTFTAIDKFGLNPKAIPADPPTPSGAIYAYPSNYLFTHGVWKMPFPMNDGKKFLWFFKPNNLTNIDDPNNLKLLDTYARQMGSNLQAEVAKLHHTAQDQDVKDQWHAAGRDKYIKGGYGGNELPVGSHNYFKTNMGQKPAQVPLNYFATQGPSGRYKPQAYQPEGPAFADYEQHVKSAQNIGQVKSERTEDLFWWLPFMWAQGSIARWGQVYRKMGVQGILDNGHHRIHPAQPVQAVIFDTTGNRILNKFDLTIGTNSATKGTSIQHGQSRKPVDEYKQRSLIVHMVDFLKLMDQNKADFGTKDRWGRVTKPDSDDMLLMMDKWGRKIHALARKVKSLEGLDKIEVDGRSLEELQAVDSTNVDSESRPAVEYIKNALLRMARRRT